MSQSLLIYGSREPLPEQTELRAGPLSLIYESGDLRYIRLGEHEILRRVYVAVRDQNWGTVPPRLSNVQLQSGPDTFSMSYDVANKEGDVDFSWHGTITGAANGTITLTMKGQAHTTFKRNRIGYCVLQPVNCAGVVCHIEHVDGSGDTSQFPEYIAPQLKIDGLIKPVPPFEEMRAMSWPIASNLQVEVRFEGETFEMEDQRNWTDASYKTYGTPLRLPFPVEVPAGTTISQSITISLKGEIPAAKATPPTTAALSCTIDHNPLRPLPRLGLGVASHGQPLSQQEIERLRSLNLSHLRLDLQLSQPDTLAKLQQATLEARALGVALEVALFCSSSAEAELKHLASQLPDLEPPLESWLLFQQGHVTTPAELVALARQYLTPVDPAVKIGGGTNSFFTELNCVRPRLAGLNFITYSLNPQVHAFDNQSLVETLAAQAITVESARQFCAELPLRVSPVTLKMRFNPNATGPEPDPLPGQLPPQVDVRQMSLFGAVWTLGSLKYLAESDTTSLTYYETSGWRGVMETAAGSPAPFPSTPGTVFPLFHVLADVGEFAGGQVLSCPASDSLQLAGLALRQDNKLRLLVANLTSQTQQVIVHNLGPEATLRLLDETNAAAASQSPETYRSQAGSSQPTEAGRMQLQLLPYAIATLDSTLG